jgi:hypothetical protein
MLKMPEFKQSRETQIIYELFRAIDARDPPLVTHHELCEATGKPLRDIRGFIATAIRRCLNDHAMVIESDRGIGYRLRGDGDLRESGRKAVERSRKIQRVGLRKMQCADESKLDPEQRANHFMLKSVLEIGLLNSRPRTMSNIEQMVRRKHNELNPEEMVAAIKESLSRK